MIEVEVVISCILFYLRKLNVYDYANSLIGLVMFQPQIFTLTNLSGVKPRQDLGQNGIEDMIQLT